MTIVNPIHAAEIGKAFSDYSTLINAEPRHPTETTKGSVWVVHADATTSHWQIRRPMSMREARRQKRQKRVEEGRKLGSRVRLTLKRLKTWLKTRFG